MPQIYRTLQDIMGLSLAESLPLLSSALKNFPMEITRDEGHISHMLADGSGISVDFADRTIYAEKHEAIHIYDPHLKTLIVEGV